ncbi:dienelactone hydrolase family protein [Saccharospirillum impatiens]|uniref:dienelactone hydrolase family protein n=1 Tax=Saccharospirillum impatiens TaxID=169438 RepID=UPI00040D4A0C|nr:dienelactone hydrolase family protein [Saccharospirillum impatiens]
MASTIELTASDQHRFALYVAEPKQAPRGAIVVLQEIFGVNKHIRSVCDRLADAGFVAAAPALFDRLQPGFETGYEPEDVRRGREMKDRFSLDNAQVDIAAVVDHLKPNGSVSIIGFCLGGSLAYQAATQRPDLACAVCYYGGSIPDLADAPPLCPTILHFGEQDSGIPMEKVDIVRSKQPKLPVYTYPAGHGFNCDLRGSYEPDSAKQAWARTMALIAEVSV